MYNGWDCHNYTSDCRAYWSELQSRGSGMGGPMTAEATSQLFGKLLAAPFSAPARQALIKMRQRSGAQGYLDPHVPGLNVTRLLEAVASADHELLNAVLTEIGQTCVQGDSHRLLMLHASLQPPKQD